MLVKNLNLSKILILFSSMFISTISHTSDFDRCTQYFYSKSPPLVTNTLLAKNNFDLCYSGFAVKYSGISKTGLWSASILTPESLSEAYKIKRNNTFHEEERIPMEFRSLLSDYRGSNMDRGHLSPSGDRKSHKDQYDSFSLANMLPQSPSNNQQEWRLAEEAIRAYVTRYKQPVYVITGSLFLGNKLRKIGNNILVPSHIYKVVLFPKLNVAGAYVAVNDESGRYDYVSVNQLQQFSGIIYFPTVSKSELFDYRFVLPFNSNEAVNMKNFRLAPDNTSLIFKELPRSGTYNKPSDNHEIKTQVQKNRSEIVDLATNAAKSNADLITDWVRKILSK
jgi:endonuclease G